jgi:Flp pilus assembly protein TadD
LYILKKEHLSWKLSAALGVCLGAALLAKFTAVFAVIPILGALLWRWLQKRDGSLSYFAARLAIVFATCALICGYHYGRTWIHFGTPLIGNWDSRTGFSYWQDDGYRTSASLLRFGKVLSQPWFSGSDSLPDGLYSTLWGDGLLGGTANVAYRPPWNYDLMTVGYWLALVPTMLAVCGGVIAVRRFLRDPSPQWFLLLSLGFLATFALVHGCFLWPSSGTAKAFYALPALVPFSALGALGFAAVQRRFPGLRPVVVISLSVWVLNTASSFWIAPSSSGTLIARVNSLREQGRYPQAISALMDGVESHPRDTEIRSFLVDTLLRTGANAEAGKQAEVLLLQEPRNSAGHFGSMMALALGGQISEAADHGWKALETAPGDVEIYEQLAKLLLRQENYGEAARVAREGLGMDPFSPLLRFSLGTALMVHEENGEAISQLQLASSLRPQWVAPHGLLGGILAAQNRLDEAAIQYSLAVRLDSKNPAPHLDLGKVLALQGKFKEATNHLCEALRLEPNNEQAALELSAVLAKNADQK